MVDNDWKNAAWLNFLSRLRRVLPGEGCLMIRLIFNMFQSNGKINCGIFTACIELYTGWQPGAMNCEITPIIHCLLYENSMVYFIPVSFLFNYEHHFCVSYLFYDTAWHRSKERLNKIGTMAQLTNNSCCLLKIPVLTTTSRKSSRTFVRRWKRHGC